MDNNLRLAHEIMKYVGGANNIATLNHCSTRLRLTINNEESFQVDEIKKIEGVFDVVKSMGGYQIIVGNNVAKVYKEIVSNYSIKVTENSGKVASNPFEAVMDALAKTMGPAIPAIVVGGLFSAIIVLLGYAGLSAESTTMVYLTAASQAAFYFLPFIVAYTSAKYFNCSPVLALFLAAIMMYPDVAALAGTNATFFGLPVTTVNYANSLIPMVLTIWMMSYVERFAEKYVPSAVRYVFVPLLIVVVMMPIALCVTGPLGTLIGNLLGSLIMWVNGIAPWATVLVVGCVAPFMVLTGTHLALLPLLISNFSTLGYDNTLLVAFIGMNFSQFAVSAAVFFKAKSPSLKATASSTALTAFLTGTTEPALYGLSVRLKKPLIATFIGCIANGIYCAILGVKIYSFGAPSFFTMANFIDPAGSNNFLLAIGAAVLTIVVTFAATWILGFDETGFDQSEENVEKKALTNQ